jgi:MFS family permease
MGLVGDFATRRKITVRIASIVVSVFGLASGACSFTQYLPLMILYMAGCGMLAGIFWVILPLMMNDLTGGIHADYAYSLMVVLVATGFLIGPSSMGKDQATLQ